jgi:hypothetical protein
MQFIFTETDDRENYKYGGRLEIKAENVSESAAMVDHFRLFQGNDVESLEKRIDALKSDDLSQVMGSEKRPAYEVESCLDWEFSEVYAQWMERTLGYDGPLPDLDIPRKWDGLKHTTYQASLTLDGGHICFKAYCTAAPWAGKDAATYAESLVVDYLAEEFGTRRHEPEFIQARNNTWVKNPEYHKRHKATPAASNTRLKRALFAWWIENHANDAQLDVVEGNRKIQAETGPYMSAFAFNGHESTIYHGRKMNKDGETQDFLAMSYAEFAKLGQLESA